MSPAQAWIKALKECPPRSLTSAEMREAFGVRKKRKLGRSGVRVDYIDYQTDELMNLYLNSNVEDVEILRWDGDIGAISVRADDGPWSTVMACDPMWIGKTDSDLRVWLSERAADDKDESAARRNFINNVNSESYRLKRLAGLISLPKTAADIAGEVARFSKFTDTAERRRAAGEYRELLGDLEGDLEFGPVLADPASAHKDDEFATSVNISDENSME